MDQNALAETLAEHVNSMTKGQYLLLAMALRKVGGSVSFTADELGQSSVAPLPGLEIAIADDIISLNLTPPQESAGLN